MLTGSGLLDESVASTISALLLCTLRWMFIKGTLNLEINDNFLFFFKVAHSVGQSAECLAAPCRKKTIFSEAKVSIPGLL